MLLSSDEMKTFCYQTVVRRDAAGAFLGLYSLLPNTHRRRDETVESRRVGVGGVCMNSRRLPTDSAMRTHNAAVWVTTADGCVHTDDTTKLSPTSCKFVYTPPTRRDSTVSSRRRRGCVLGL